MAPVDTYVIPRYSRDHFAYFEQVCEWYLDKGKYKAQLLAFHSDRSRHFYQWLTERQNTNGENSIRELVEEQY